MTAVSRNAVDRQSAAAPVTGQSARRDAMCRTEPADISQTAARVMTERRNGITSVHQSAATIVRQSEIMNARPSAVMVHQNGLSVSTTVSQSAAMSGSRTAWQNGRTLTWRAVGIIRRRSQQEREESARPPMWESDLDSGIIADGILEVMQDGYGFIRCENFMPGENDVYVSPSQIRKFNLKTGDILRGNTRIKTQGEKFSALLYLKSVNGLPPYEASRRANFEDVTPSSRTSASG